MTESHNIADYYVIRCKERDVRRCFNFAFQTWSTTELALAERGADECFVACTVVVVVTFSAPNGVRCALILGSHAAFNAPKEPSE